MNNDNKNFVLFAVIAALILFGWPLLQGKFFPTANPPVTKVQDGKSKPLPQPQADPAADSPAATRALKTVLTESAAQRVAIDTPTLKGSINLKGARIDDLILAKYGETVAKNSPPIRLLTPSGAPDAYFVGFSWGNNGLNPPAPDTVWQASGTVLAPGKPVTLDAANAAGQRFRIALSVDDSYMFTVAQTVANAGSAPVPVATYNYVGRFGHSKDPDTWTMHTGPTWAANGGAVYDISFDNLDGKEPGFWSRLFGTKAVAGDNPFSSTGGWFGFSDKYWLTALIPDQGALITGKFRGDRKFYNAEIFSQSRLLQPGKKITQQSRFFAGAKEVATLQNYQNHAGVPLFDKAIDWGWFEIFEKPIFLVLDWLFRMIGNFGLAIICLTFIVRGLMFPIAQRQFASMASMRAIQPKMKALQERYKDDKVRQQQEIMALYKAEKVNPLAGCAPTLLQIPVFYALYKVLMLTIEMRHQPFALWIKDLSAPDPATVLNLFGYLNFTPPHFLAIGVIPVLLGISMYFQFKLNPAPMDETQKQVFSIMPWMLMFVMAPFAAGLQVYWITSNCLTMAQQRWLYSRHPALKQAPVK